MDEIPFVLVLTISTYLSHRSVVYFCAILKIGAICLHRNRVSGNWVHWPEDGEIGLGPRGRALAVPPRPRPCFQCAAGHAAPPAYQCLWAGQYLPILLLSTTVLKKLASYVYDSTTYVLHTLKFTSLGVIANYLFDGGKANTYSIMAPYFLRKSFFLNCDKLWSYCFTCSTLMFNLVLWLTPSTMSFQLTTKHKAFI